MNRKRLPFALILSIICAASGCASGPPSMKDWSITDYYPDKKIFVDFNDYVHAEGIPDATVLYFDRPDGHHLVIIPQEISPGKAIYYYLEYDKLDQRINVKTYTMAPTK